jgi:hypothetical protein
MQQGTYYFGREFLNDELTAHMLPILRTSASPYGTLLAAS